MKEFKINNHNNISLNIIEGLPIDDPKAIVINVHGIGAHFQEIFESEDNISYRDSLFYPNNIKLYGLEFHGHGKSDGIRCSIDNFDDLLPSSMSDSTVNSEDDYKDLLPPENSDSLLELQVDNSDQNIDYDDLNKCAKLVSGEHDFTQLSKKNMEIKNKICHVYDSIWERDNNKFY